MEEKGAPGRVERDSSFCLSLLGGLTLSSLGFPSCKVEIAPSCSITQDETAMRMSDSPGQGLTWSGLRAGSPQRFCPDFPSQLPGCVFGSSPPLPGPHPLGTKDQVLVPRGRLGPCSLKWPLGKRSEFPGLPQVSYIFRGFT